MIKNFHEKLVVFIGNNNKFSKNNSNLIFVKYTIEKLTKNIGSTLFMFYFLLASNFSLKT